MGTVEIVDGAAVGDHIPFKAPLVAQDINQQLVATATGFPFIAVVGAHEGIGVAGSDQLLECRQVGVPYISQGRAGIKRMAIVLGTAVYGIVLGRGNGLEIFVVVSLKSFYKRYAQCGCQIGILSIRFLSPAPPGVAKDVDVGCPEGQSIVLVLAPGAQGLMILGPCFVGDYFCRAKHGVCIERGRHTNSLGKDRGNARSGNAMQAFVPPIVGWNSKAVDGRGVVHHLADFLFQRHAADQVIYPHVDGQTRVLKGQALCRPREGQQKCRQDE